MLKTRTAGALVRGFATTALAQHELPAHDRPDRLTLELYGIMLAADTNFVLHDDPAVLNLAGRSSDSG